MFKNHSWQTTPAVFDTVFSVHLLIAFEFVAAFTTGVGPVCTGIHH
jgi:hypothetical protein